MKKNENNSLFTHWKEVSAVVTSLLGTTISILTVWEKVDPKFRFPALLICASVCFCYVIFRKVPSQNTYHLFGISIYKIEKVILIIFVVIMFLIPALSSPKPIIEKIIPVDPVAGNKLQLFGRNFPERSNIELKLGSTRLTDYNIIDKQFIEVEVPENVSSGPLYLKKKRKILPDINLIYPIVSIQKKDSGVILITEDIRSNVDQFKILFSILNASEQSTATVYDVQLEIIDIQAIATPNYQQERIDLGIVSIIGNYLANMNMDLLNPREIHLLEQKAIKLPPLSSESFSCNVLFPNSQQIRNLKFIISVEFFNSDGTTGTVYSNRIFSITSDIDGIFLFDSLPYNKELREKITQKHHDERQDVIGEK
jgi:hypothetical protein